MCPGSEESPAHNAAAKDLESKRSGPQETAQPVSPHLPTLVTFSPLLSWWLLGSGLSLAPELVGIPVSVTVA